MTDDRYTPLLDQVKPHFREQALSALAQGEVGGWLMCESNEKSLRMVLNGCAELMALGLYEKALLEAWIMTRTNRSKWSLGLLRTMFEVADADRMRAASDPLPGPGPFTIYRGVAGRGPARRVRGLSWTGSQREAAWFANRAALMSLADPAVFGVHVEEHDVLSYTDDREEQEFIVLLPKGARPVRVLEGQDVHRLADEYIAARSQDDG